MTLQSRRQLENTRKKLNELERMYAEAQERPVGNAYTRELTLRSLKRTINQLKEEIARYQSRAKTAENA